MFLFANVPFTGLWTSQDSLFGPIGIHDSVLCPFFYRLSLRPSASPTIPTLGYSYPQHVIGTAIISSEYLRALPYVIMNNYNLLVTSLQDKLPQGTKKIQSTSFILSTVWREALRKSKERTREEITVAIFSVRRKISVAIAGHQ